LCWEAQSLGFASSNVFGSANHNTIATPYSNGWAVVGLNGAANPTEHSLLNTAQTTVIDLQGTTAPAGGQTVRYYGLPMIGFAAQTFQNDAITIGGRTYLSTFAASLPHHEIKKVQ
jgi:hypothetical protein